MASLKIALLVFACLEGYALTSAFNVAGLQNVPDDLKATGDVCKDCTQIFELLTDLFSDADLQKKIMDGIETVCDHLPGPATTAKLCKEEVEKMLPVAISFLTGVVKPAQACKFIGLCGTCDKQEKMLSHFAKEALQAAVTSENAQTTQCTFCIFLIKTLEDLLPKERTEDALIKLLEEICHIMPHTYRDQCEAVIGRFSKTVLDAILSYATPQAICALMHMCKGQEAPLVDPCSLASLRCRDIETALKCGTMSFCQRFAWKPLYRL